MRWQQELSFILRRLIYRRHAERELDDEIRAHLEMEIEQNIADGMSPEDARLAARRSFGSVALSKENSRSIWGFGPLEILWQDLRYGLRMMLRNPGFTVVAVITLSLGIAANTTIFSLADALVLRPFDFPHQDRLVFAWEPKPQAEGERDAVAPGNFIDWREQSQSFERLVALMRRPFNLTGIDQPERLSGFRVSVGFFDALGVKAALGRTFLPGEDEPGRNQVVVLTARLWQRSFGGDPNVVGRTIQLNAEAFVVIGVLPADFSFQDSEIWTPLVLDEQAKLDRAVHNLGVIGLLKPGIGIAQADADLDMISQRAQRLFPETNAGRTASVIAMNEYVLSDTVKEFVSVLTGVVALVLLIACANVANLLIGRALARRKEIAVRLALGASRWRLIRQMLTESMLLAFAGGAIGLLLSVLAVDLLRRGMPEDIAKIIIGFDNFAVNRAALLVTLLVSGLSSLLFGLMPAWQATRPNPNEFLKEGARGALSAGSSHRSRGALVVSEVALSLVLLIGAGLMIRSFVAMINDDLGFNPHNALGLYISLSEEKYPAEKRRIFYDQLLRQLETLPGVASVGATSKLPLSVDGDLFKDFAIVGEPPFEKGKEPVASYRIVSPGYFGVIGMPLKRGRDFTTQDDESSAGVAVVNEAFARRFFSNREVIGQRITTSGRTDKSLEIIGVVGDVMDDEFGLVTAPYLYAAYAQDSRTEMGIVVRTAGDPTPIAAAVRKEVMNLDPTQPVFHFKTIERIVREWHAPERIMTVLMSVFAGIALLMAVVGLYAVMAYAVLQRTHEIGVRLALGAQARNILRLIAGQGLKLTLIGLTLGLAGALALTRVMSPLLYRVSAVDPTTFILISLLLLFVALLACWLPARRATKVDPMIALRCE